MGEIKDKTLIQLVGYVFQELVVLKDDSDELKTVSKTLGYMYK